MTLLETIETDLVDIWDDVEAWFASLSKEEQTLLGDVESVVEKLQAALENPSVVTLASLIPDGIGTTIESILNTILADVLAGVTYLEGLSTTTGASANAVLAGDAVGVLSNQDAVARVAVSKIAGATPDLQAATLNSYGNIIFTKIAPSNTNLTIGKINLARALKKQIKIKTA
jgi:hypothetical protein